MNVGSLFDLWVAATFVGIAIRWLVGWNVELLTAIIAGGIIVVLWEAGFEPGPLVAAIEGSAPEFLAGSVIGLGMMHFARGTGTNR